MKRFAKLFSEIDEVGVRDGADLASQRLWGKRSAA